MKTVGSAHCYVLGIVSQLTVGQHVTWGFNCPEACFLPQALWLFTGAVASGWQIQHKA